MDELTHEFGHMREAFLAPRDVKEHKFIYRKMRRLFLGRELPQTEIESKMVLQMRGMVDTGKLWLEQHPQANVTIVFNQFERYIGGIDDGLRRGFVKVSPDGLKFLKALWPWEDRNIPTVTMVKVVFDEITRSRK